MRAEWFSFVPEFKLFLVANGAPRADLVLKRSAFSTLYRHHTKSAGQRLSQKRQALVHPVIDTGMIVGEFLVAMRDAELA
jgi:hypothetical protein